MKTVTLPHSLFESREMLTTAVRCNNRVQFEQLIAHAQSCAFVMDVNEIAQAILETPIAHVQWLQSLNNLQKLSRSTLELVSASALKTNDTHLMLFVFNQLTTLYNLKRHSILLEYFPIYTYAEHLLAQPPETDVQQALEKMLQICSPAQCTNLVKRALRSHHFDHIALFAPHIDMEHVKWEVQFKLQQGDGEYEAAVAYFQNQALTKIVSSEQMQTKRKM